MRRGADLPEAVWLDLVLILVLIGFAWLGAWRGALESGLRLAAWIAGYAAAALAASRAGGPVADLLGAPAWLGMPLAGAFAFLAVQIAVAIAIVLARRRREPGGRSAGDRVLGGVLGAARGGLLVLLVGWLALFADALLAQLAASPPPLERSRAARLSGAVVESGAEAVLGREDPAARAATALAAHPRQALGALRDVLGHPRVLALQEDAEFWRLVEAGEIEVAMALPSARALTRDAELRAQLASLGLVEDSAAADPKAFERAIEEALAVAAVRVAELRADPELRALLEDPEVLALVERGDAFRLLTHPRFRSVLQRATSS
jgi:membrane protein required for colicin V production